MNGDIQRKLDLIDKQLTGNSIHKQIISSSPLVFLAVGLIIGILIQNTFNLSLSLWLTLLALCAISAILLFVIQTSGRLSSYAPALLSICALFCFICLGSIRLTSYYQPGPQNIRNFVTDEAELATIRGLIVTRPHKENQQWEFARFRYADPASSFYLKITEVKTIDGWAKVSGTVRVQVAEPILDLKAGDYIQAYCWLDRFKQPTNPGQFNIAKYLARKNVFIAASVKSRDGIELLRSAANNNWSAIVTKVKRKARQKATEALLGSPSPESKSEGLLQALLLGYRANISNDVYQAFHKTGLLHFISLSGMHLGIFIGIIWWLGKTAGLLKRGRAIVCIIAIVIFLLVVPPRAPTVRAAIIGFVFCLAYLFRRRFNSLNTLSLAAIILLLIRPTQLFEPGWQLSFACVLGLILLCHRIHFFLYEKITALRQHNKLPTTKPFYRIVARPGPYLLRLFSTGLTAWLSGAGILLYHFYSIHPLTFIWTVAVFPLVAMILIIGYLKIILSFLLPTAAAILGIIVTGLADLLIWMVKLFAHLDISQILIGHVPLEIVILYYTFIIFSFFAYFRWPLIKKVICTAMALAIIVFLGVTKWQRTHRNDLILSCLDVSHGQAILAQLPGKANILFDAGSLHISDVGRRIIAPFLDYIGISKLDAIIISHNDIDHLNGIPELVDHCQVSNIYTNDAFFSQTAQASTTKFLQKRLLAKGHKIQHLSNNLNLRSAANVTILWPAKYVSQNEELSDNDKSLVSLIGFAGRKILLCSDIEKFAQAELLQLYPELKVDVVVVPHHGSTRTTDPDFLPHLNANILIYSCSRTQYDRRPLLVETKHTARRKRNTKSFYTARHGASTVCIDKDGLVKTETFIK